MLRFCSKTIRSACMETSNSNTPDLRISSGKWKAGVLKQSTNCRWTNNAHFIVICWIQGLAASRCRAAERRHRVSRRHETASAGTAVQAAAQMAQRWFPPSTPPSATFSSEATRS